LWKSGQSVHFSEILKKSFARTSLFPAAFS